MIEQALREWNIWLPGSYAVGDSRRDVIAARRMGIAAIGVETGPRLPRLRRRLIVPDRLVDDLGQAVDMILASSGGAPTRAHIMITTQTPFRLSFFGGGSDIGSFYSRHPGAVLSVAINKSMYMTTHPYFEPTAIHLKYSKTELVPSVDRIEHPILRAVLSELVPNGGIEVASIADIPGGTGLGSSSAFTVGLIQNLNARFQRFLPPARLAEAACHIEIEILKEPIGKQDQYASAFRRPQSLCIPSRRQNERSSGFFCRPTPSSDWKPLCSYSISAYRVRPRQSFSEQVGNLAEAEIFETQKAMVAQVECRHTAVAERRPGRLWPAAA